MSQEKTEAPTPRRLERARQRGDHPLSSALVQAASGIAVMTALPGALVLLVGGVWRLFQSAVEPGAVARGVARSTELSLQAMTLASAVVVPLLLVGAGAAFVVGAAQTQARIAPERIAPNLEGLNLAKGFGRLLDASRLFSLARAAGSALFVSATAWWLLSDSITSLVASAGELGAALPTATRLCRSLLWAGLLASALLAAIDVLVSRRTWLRRLRMSPDEIKREHKDNEGDPAVKAERQRAYQEMLRSIELGNLRDATVVIVNPTHVATALRYDPSGDGAPVVIAKGQDHQAQAIRDAARAYGVPVVRDVAVARALYALDLGEEIPGELFQAVAEILHELYQLSGENEDG